MQSIFTKTWYGTLNFFSLILLPFSILFFLAITVRKFLYKIGIFKKYTFKTPVIIIGNLTVGGTGKTPLTIWLCNYLTKKGLKIGIISSGYKSKNKTPKIINEYSQAKIHGDEAVLIHKKTKSCVISGGNRIDATAMMEKEFDCNLIIHDDGLQHYALDRDLEIVLIDAKRKFGNGLLLPAGPLRETQGRLKDTDLVVMNNSFDMDVPSIQTANNNVFNSETSETRQLSSFSGKKIHLVTAIGTTQNIEISLNKYKIAYVLQTYPDHYIYTGKEIEFDDNLPVFVTEKDYLKLNKNKKLWVIQLDILPNIKFIIKLDNCLDRILQNEN